MLSCVEDSIIHLSQNEHINDSFGTSSVKVIRNVVQRVVTVILIPRVDSEVKLDK